MPPVVKVEPVPGPESAAPTLSFRVHLLLHLVTALLLFGAAWLLTTRPELAIHWHQIVTPLVTAGIIVALLPAFHRRRKFSRFSAGLCVSISSFLLLVAVVEIGFRLAGFDFRRQEAFLRRVPPCYQKPRVPTGEVFFRHPGPLTWTGQVLKAQLAALRLSTEPYRDEPVVTIHYNRFGFRDADDLTAWDLAVAGDSFTELGYLPDRELFTTILGRRLHLRVLNLGVASTGPLTYLSYLKDYGLCPQLRQTLVVFYEGNDMEDLRREDAALKKFQATGQRPSMAIHKQTSFLRALGERLRRTDPTTPTGLPVDAYFLSAHGKVPVSLEPPPRGRADEPPAALQALAFFAREYAAFARQHGVRPWLAYMPCKMRIWHGHLEFTDRATDAIKQWKPTDLPAVVAGECARNGIGFIDLTPALRDALERSGDLLYNTIYDTHLNARGSAVVADALARALSPPAASH
jgi:hypothetical protein